jgi:hypothetical protein
MLACVGAGRVGAGAAPAGLGGVHRQHAIAEGGVQLGRLRAAHLPHDGQQVASGQPGRFGQGHRSGAPLPHRAAQRVRRRPLACWRVAVVQSSRICCT